MHRRGRSTSNAGVAHAYSLVIGGTQFMGREIVQRLAGRGHEVTVLHRRGSHDLGDGIHNLQADRADLGTLTQLLGDHTFEDGLLSRT